MNQIEFNRRQLMALMGSAAVAAGLPNSALAQDAALKFWAPGIAKVGAKDWSDMAKQSGIEIAAIARVPVRTSRYRRWWLVTAMRFMMQ